MRSIGYERMRLARLSGASMVYFMCMHRNSGITTNIDIQTTLSRYSLDL